MRSAAGVGGGERGVGGGDGIVRAGGGGSGAGLCDGERAGVDDVRHARGRGGAGGGMRWPNRNPHSLTAGMRKAQQALARFLPLINWQQFKRANLNEEIMLTDKTLAGFCCGDTDQAVLWILRLNNLDKKGMLRQNNATSPSVAQIPGLMPGVFEITIWDTGSGIPVKKFSLHKAQEGSLCVPVPPVTTNLAFAVKRVDD